MTKIVDINRHSDRCRGFDKILGIIFLLIGFLGFLDIATPNGKLLGLFMVNSTHNMVHILSGAVLLATGIWAHESTARAVTLAIAIIYGLVTIMGFMVGNNGMVMGMQINMADNILHLIITLAALAVAIPRESRLHAH